MTRPLRIDIAGGCYHVASRGNERHNIFRDDRDRAHFLELLETCAEQYGVRFHAYVLMDNHYHLLLTTPEPNLSKAMQWLNVSYSVWFNRRHERTGHLFQGRFKSVVVEEERWTLALSAYMHLNPVRISGLGLDKHVRKAQHAGVWRSPTPEELKRRLETLRGYKWSSYFACAGYGSIPKWLCCGEILERLNGVSWKERITMYRRYVEDQLREGEPETLWTQAKAGVVLGTEEFIDRIRDFIKGNTREQREIKNLENRPGFKDVVRIVEGIKGEGWDVFHERYGDWGRDLVLWVARRRCGLMLSELGQAAGGMDYVCVGNAIARMDKKIKSDHQMRKIADNVLLKL